MSIDTTTILASGDQWTLRQDAGTVPYLEFRDLAYQCQTHDAMADGPHTIIAVAAPPDLVALLTGAEHYRRALSRLLDMIDTDMRDGFSRYGAALQGHISLARKALDATPTGKDAP